MLSRIIGRLSLAIGFCLLVAARAGAQSTAALSLKITAYDSGQPLADAEVSIPALKLGAWSDSTGVVRVARIPVGTQLVEISRLGYRTERVAIDFTPGGTADGDVQLLPVPVKLDAVSVTGQRTDPAMRSSGFYDRAAKGVGSFLTGPELARRQEASVTLGDLLRNMRGIEIVPTASGHAAIATHGSASILATGPCTMPVYLDGVAVNTPDIDAIVSARDVAGIEVYDGPSEVPPQFNVGPCGVVLVWTRVR